MNANAMKIRWRRAVWLAFSVFGATLVALTLWLLRPALYESWLWPGRGTIVSVSNRQDVRWKNLRKLDLRAQPDVVRSLRFNQKTRWPAVDRIPVDLQPGVLLTNAMNPGLGVRQLHASGITGKGVRVAIIDYSIEGKHPEYAANIVEIHRIAGAHSPSMHGPAVASLLVGARCGTAPGAKLHFVAVPDGVGDATHYADALDWIVRRNDSLLPGDKIRIVSISAAPSGKALWRFRNGERYDAAVARAEAAGLLVIDGTQHRGLVGPCNLDPLAPEDPARCRAIPARRKTADYWGRILAPTGPRTTAEEYRRGDRGYQYCGLQTETLFSAGSSWSMPYCAGVLALGLQLRPEMSAEQIKELLFQTAYVLNDGAKIIDPKAFIDALKANPS